MSDLTKVTAQNLSEIQVCYIYCFSFSFIVLLFCIVKQLLNFPAISRNDGKIYASNCTQCSSSATSSAIAWEAHYGVWSILYLAFIARPEPNSARLNTPIVSPDRFHHYQRQCDHSPWNALSPQYPLSSSPGHDDVFNVETPPQSPMIDSRPPSVDPDHHTECTNDEVYGSYGSSTSSSIPAPQMECKKSSNVLGGHFQV